MKPVLNVFQGKPEACPPIWLMRQAGRYLPEYQKIRQNILGFMDLCFHEDLATEVTLQPLRRFGFDAAIIFSDILVVPHVLGQTVRIIEKQGPVLEPIEEKKFFNKARDVDLQEALSVPLKVIHNVRKALPPTKTVIGFSGSPWTVATYMLEQGKSRAFQTIKNHLETGSTLFTQTMALLEEAIGTFLIAQIHAGADVVQIFDSWAKAVPEAYRQEWIVSPIQRLVSRIRAVHPDTPIIYYGRGVSDLYPKISEGLSFLAFGVDEEVPVPVMKKDIQKLAPVQGNLSPEALVRGGEYMRHRVAKLLEAFRGSPYVFNLGHGILPQTPVDHVAQLIDLVRERDVLK